MPDEQPRFGWTVLYVDDIDTALNFYGSACNLTVRYRHETGQYAELETGLTTLALCDRRFAAESIGVDTSTPGQVMTFNITLVGENVEAAFNLAVSNGARPIRQPVTKPWGQISSYVADPDDNLIEIATTVPA